MGLKKMLIQGVANEQAEIDKMAEYNKKSTDEPEKVEVVETNKKEEAIKNPKSDINIPNISKEAKEANEPEKVKVVETNKKEEAIKNPKSDINIPNISKEAKEVKKTNQKGKTGRPTYAEKGRKKRKQYTVTLLEEDYNVFLEKAHEKDISLSKLIEYALFDYLDLN